MLHHGSVIELMQSIATNGFFAGESIVVIPHPNKADKYIISPYKIIEYNNRWFVFCLSHNSTERKLGVYALDRICSLQISNEKYKKTEKNKLQNYFSDIIGVTNYLEKDVEKILFKVYGVRAKYVETKPIHKSLKIEKRCKDYVLFSLKLKINPELEAFMLNLGSDIEIIAPKYFRNEIQQKLKTALHRYEK